VPWSWSRHEFDDPLAIVGMDNAVVELVVEACASPRTGDEGCWGGCECRDGQGVQGGRTRRRVDRPGDLGGSDPWRGWEPCRHSGGTPRSCASAR